MTIRALGLIFTVTFLFLFLSPMFIYWWGLSNLKTEPIPSQVKLTLHQERKIWSKEREVGIPRIKSINAYEYILWLYCNADKGLYANGCREKYPGLNLSALAVRQQVINELAEENNIAWHVTWSAYAIWVTQHWDIHQILATYHDAYDS